MVMVFIYISLSKKNVEVFSNKIKIKRMVEWKNLNVGLTWAFLMGRYCQFRRDVGAKKNEALPFFRGLGALEIVLRQNSLASN